MITETQGTGAHMVSEADGTRSRTAGTLADSTVDYVAGTVVALVGGEYVRHDGTNAVAGVLFEGADANAGSISRTFHVRDCEVNAEELHWTADGTTVLSAAQITAGETALAALGIIVR